MYAPKSRRQGGFSLVSLMVGLVISLLVGLTAMGSLQSFTVTQRQSVGVGSVLGSGMSTLGVVKYELAQAGRGLYQNGAPICTAVNFSTEDAVQLDGDELRPLNVAWDEEGRLTMDIRYATALEVGTPVLLQGSVSKDGVAEVVGRFRVAVGQAVLLAPAEGAPGVCTVRTVTEVEPATSEHGVRLTFGSTGTHNKAAFEFEASYVEGSRVFLLGALDHVQFRFDGATLRMARPLQGQDIVLSTGTRAFNIQLATVNPVSGALNDWVTPYAKKDPAEEWQDLTAARMQDIRAVRVGLILQSNQRDKPDIVSGECTSTPATNAPTLFGELLSLSEDDSCFKFRAFTGVIPLRNVQLGQAAS